MAAYVKQGDNIVLIFSKAEASALRDIVRRTQAIGYGTPDNNMTAAALDRAMRCVSVACEPGSRSGAAIQ